MTVCTISRTRRFALLSLAALVCLTASEQRAAAAAPNVTYTASGVFATTPLSGNDLFRLAGQPFSISVVANEAMVSTHHGAQWAVYNNLKMTGTVQSGLLPTPTAISNNVTNILLAAGNPNVDIFQLGTPVKVVGLTLTITASISMPKGTITNDHVLPFTAPVTVTPSNATVTYSDGTNTTTLAIQQGTLNATLSGSTTTAGLALFSSGAEAIAVNADGTKSVRSVQGSPLVLGSTADSVVLQFYAAGVRNASDVHVSIAGQEAPVLYAGPSNHFTGLDQVSIQVSRSLAGAVDVVLTADGQNAAPVRLLIQ